MSILMVCCHFLFTEVYISSWDQILCKAHKVGKRLHLVFAPIGLELKLPWPMGNIKLP